MVIKKSKKRYQSFDFKKKFVTQGTKRILGKIWSFQVLNVTQIFVEKSQKNAQKAFNFLIQILKNRCVINATAAPLIREIKTTLAVVTCTSFMANSLWFFKVNFR